MKYVGFLKNVDFVEIVHFCIKGFIFHEKVNYIYVCTKKKKV